MACFDRASPALKETLLKLHCAKKPMEIDQRIYEFGAVEYHVQSSVSEPYLTHLSISTPLLSEEFSSSNGLSYDAIQMIKEIRADALEIVEPAKDGYQLTIRLNLSKIPPGKESIKVITEISTEQLQGMYRPIKLVYHHREPFFVIRQPRKITAVFPMRFKEDPDVIIATAFFQELMDVGSSEEWAKAPPYITSHHVKGKRLDRTVWSLLNFHAFVKYHVKCTRGFIQRRMRKRLDSLVKILHSEGPDEEREHEEEPKGCGCMSSFASTSRAKNLKRRCRNLFVRKSNRIRSPVKVRGGMRFRHRWLKIQKFSSPRRYTKLD
ncbi:hypothetical protein CRG98_005008 [Punica granatum]|uniref:Arp2/3 complex 34 kDa subunit n=1 Tax=Punica granatum TaxID=22663 RepID=A0A2I0L1V3_PUNGR|nr:hypothetical protein CRG98_005008 [Punica granatum]